MRMGKSSKPQAVKILAAKAAVDKETWQKSEVSQRWSMKQGRRALQFILHHFWTYVIWKIAELEARNQKYKGRVKDSGSYALFMNI